METRLTGQQETELREALFRGEKITAIKTYREATGSELKEAKTAVDALEKELRQTTPQSFQRVERRGCLEVLLLILGVAGWVLYRLS